MTIIPNKSQIDNPIFECCKGFFKRFQIVKILRQCGAFKKAGIQVGTVFLFLLGLVFEHKKLNILKTHYPDKMPFGKDVVYRCLSRGDVNWERMVFLSANEVKNNYFVLFLKFLVKLFSKSLPPEARFP